MPKRLLLLWPCLVASLLLVVGYLVFVPIGELLAAPLAVTLQVDRLDDLALPAGTACTAADNDCTLRGAVDTAANGDTIEIIEVGTIILQQGQIALTKDLTITSASSATHIIDGDNASHIFEIGAGQTIILNELTLQNGFNLSTQGGAISMGRGTLTMTHLLLQNNRTNLTGGALGVDLNGGDANLFLYDVTFFGNNAQATYLSGGAMGLDIQNGSAYVVIEAGHFENNLGGTLEDGYGGALSLDTFAEGATATLEIRNTDFISNSSETGGAIYLQSYNIDNFGVNSINTLIYDSYFARNQGGEGGAIHVHPLDGGSQTTLTISNTTFITNSAIEDGGALYNDILNRGDSAPNFSLVTIHNSTFYHNRAIGGDGGAIYSTVEGRDGSTIVETHVNLVNSTLSANRAEDEGAAIFAEADGITTTTSALTATHVTIFDNARGGSGDLVFVEDDFAKNLVYLKNSIVANRGGISCIRQGTATILGANNLITRPSCGNAPSFRLGAPVGVIPQLADNGGATATHGLFAGSNALNAVPAGECTLGNTTIPVTSDQRGQPRPFGTACDIGAFEVQTVTPPSSTPITGLTANNDGPTLIGETTSFTASITGGEVDFYTWDFGDGSSGGGITATHTYTKTGTYIVTIVAANAAGAPSATTTVKVEEPARAGLSLSNSGPNLVNTPTAFTSVLTNGVAISYTWDFGDGNGATGVAPTHTYTKSGVYSAKVTVTNTNNSLSATTIVYVGDAIVEVLGNNSFDPNEITVPTGSKVVWVLRGGNHSVTADDGSFEQPRGTSWPPFIHTFHTADVYDYYCDLHGGRGRVGMAGRVTVEGEDVVPSGLRLPNIVNEKAN